MRACALLLSAGVHSVKTFSRRALTFVAGPAQSKVACSTMAAAALSHLPDVERLSPRVTRVLGCNPGPFTLQGTNCYLLGTGRSKILVDTGEKENAQFLVNLHRTLKESDCGIQEVVITHWHHDHTGGIPGVHRAVSKGSPMKVSKMRQVKGVDEDLGELQYSYVEEGHVFTAEGVTLKAMYTPGHADDHMCLWMEEENALLSGDTVLGEGTAVFEDLFDYMKSLERLRTQKASVVYPAHGAVVRDPEAHISMYINHRNQREKQIHAAVKAADRALDVDEVIQAVYGELPPPLLKGARNNVGHHLKKLIKEQKIVAVDGGNRFQITQSNL